MEDTQALSDNIIVSLGLQNLPDDEKADIVERVIDVIQKRIMLRLTELLADEDDAVLDELSGDFDRLVKYIRAKVPNFDKILEEEILSVKEELVGTAAAVE